MRILFICNSSVWGGAERYVYMVAHELAARGHAVYCAAPMTCPLYKRLSLSNAVTHLHIDIGPKLGLTSRRDFVLHGARYTSQLRGLLEAWRDKFGIEIVHLQFKKEQLLATTVARGLGMTVVWTEHGPLPPDFRRSRAAMWLYRRAAGKTKAIICVAKYVASDLIDSGIAAASTTVCYNGIPLPTKDAQFTAALRLAVRRRVGITAETFVIGTIGRLTPIKGIDTFIDAVHGLARAQVDIKALIVGDGPQRQELESRVHRLHLAQHVQFLGHRQDVNDLLSAMDVMAMPSTIEGMPFAAMEAMAAGVPVIGTTVGGFPELLDHGRAGVLVSPGSAEELCDSLMQLKSNPARRAKIGAAGAKRVASLFDQNSMMAQTELILRDLRLRPRRAVHTKPPTAAVLS